MSDQDHSSLWTNLALMCGAIVAFIAGKFLRIRDWARAGRKSELQQEESDNEARRAVFSETSEARLELISHLRQLLEIANGEKSALAARLLKLESDVSTLQQLYDTSVIKTGNMHEKLEERAARIARLETENRNLDRRLSGALRRLAQAGVKDEQPEEPRVQT